VEQALHQKKIDQATDFCVQALLITPKQDFSPISAEPYSTMPPPSKRRKTSAVAEVVFDPTARADYLTGFHKRKQARIKHAQEIAVKREKEEKRKDREELRKRRQQELEEHIQAVNESMRIVSGIGGEGQGGEEEGADEGEDEQWQGLEDEVKDEEYVDEDQYATVTVEAVDITRDGFVARGDSEDESADDEGDRTNGKEAAGEVKEDDKISKDNKKPWSKAKPAGEKRRKKSRNFKYESKVDRKLNRAKDRSKRKAHAIARKSRD
jgi:ribosomal RNA-processing protein 17